MAQPVEGTLQWLVTERESDSPQDPKSLRKDDFVAWRDLDNSGPLLVTAAPRQGKSVLSNFVIDHLKDFLKPRHKVIYYFCNIKNEESSRTTSSILRALIVQLCKDRRLFRSLPNRFQEKGQAERFLSAPFNNL